MLKYKKAYGIISVLALLSTMIVFSAINFPIITTAVLTFVFTIGLVALYHFMVEYTVNRRIEQLVKVSKALPKGSIPFQEPINKDAETIDGEYTQYIIENPTPNEAQLLLDS